MSLYDDLDVAHDATPAEIKRAHRAKAKQHHPDIQGGDPAKFAIAQRAFDTLGDAEKRQRYDRTGQAEDEPDNSRTMVVELIVQAFDQSMSVDGFETRDVIAGMIQILQTLAREAKETQRRNAALKVKVESAMRRLKFTGTGGNPIATVLADRAKSIDAAIAAGDVRSGHISAAIVALEDYGWDWDRPTPPPPPPPSPGPYNACGFNDGGAMPYQLYRHGSTGGF
jgi:curved DNA-binding protein CbpA